MNDNTQITSFALEEYITNKETEILGKVDKKDFCRFIDKQERIVDIDEDATIEIISPVLNNSKYKWRGNYNNEVIEFSMRDMLKVLANTYATWNLYKTSPECKNRDAFYPLDERLKKRP